MANLRKYALETSPVADCENMHFAKIILSPYGYNGPGPLAEAQSFFLLTSLVPIPNFTPTPFATRAGDQEGDQQVTNRVTNGAESSRSRWSALIPRTPKCLVALFHALVRAASGAWSLVVP